MEVKGRIKNIGETKTFGSNGFQKREIVVTTEEQYPQHILLEFVQDKCAILDKYNEGDFVAVGINLRGREWTNAEGEVKYFNSIQGWKIDKISGGIPAPLPAEESMDLEEDEDDLPF